MIIIIFFFFGVSPSCGFPCFAASFIGLADFIVSSFTDFFVSSFTVSFTDFISSFSFALSLSFMGFDSSLPFADSFTDFDSSLPLVGSFAGFDSSLPFAGSFTGFDSSLPLVDSFAGFDSSLPLVDSFTGFDSSFLFTVSFPGFSPAPTPCTDLPKVLRTSPAASSSTELCAAFASIPCFCKKLTTSLLCIANSLASSCTFIFAMPSSISAINGALLLFQLFDDRIR